MKTLDDLKQQITKEYEQRLFASEHDYQCGINDCKAHVYDKFYCNNHRDNGRAYDLGWTYQNQFEQVEKVIFLD